MKYSLGISDFLEEISSLSHSVAFLCFFPLITEEGFIISPCYSLELCILMGISFLSPLPFVSFLFSAICKTSLANHFSFFHFFFFRIILITTSCYSVMNSVLPVNLQDWFLLGWTGLISLQSKWLSGVSSNTIVQKDQSLGTQLSL